MPQTISGDQLLQLRLRAQDVVRSLCVVQAQEPLPASLSIRPRALDFTAAGAERELVDTRSIACSWCLRVTPTGSTNPMAVRRAPSTP